MILEKFKIVTITLLTLLGTVGTPYLNAETRDSAPPRIENVDSPELIPTAPSNIMSLFDATIYDGQTYIFRCHALKVAGEYRDTIQRVSGGDSILVLTLHVTPPPTEKKVKYTATIEDGESYLFGCEMLTAAGVYKDTLESAAGLDSIVILTLNVTPATKVKVKYTADIEAGETYLFGCELLTAAGVYKDTLESAAGLDSIVTLTLKVNGNVVQTKYTADIEAGETYLFGCELLTAAGEYKDTLESASGLDSIVALTLNVTPATKIKVKYSADINPGETYLFGCELLTAAGEYRDTLESAAGLDSIVILTLKLKGNVVATKYTADIEAGETYLFGCELLTAAGEYKDTLESAAGLDSIVILTLKVNAATKIKVKYTTEINPGETYLFGCELLTAAGEYKDTLESAAGLDSIVTLTLKVNSNIIATKYTADIEAGETYLFGCELLTAAGEYKDTLESAAGLDSIVILTLKVNAPTAIKVKYSTEIEVGETYLFGCELYTFDETGPQVLKDTLVSASGLDSIVIVNLTVTGSGGITEKSVKYTADITDGQTYLFGCELLTAAGVYKDTLESVDGLDSIVVLTLNVKAITEVKVKYSADITAGETYLFGCELLTANGEYKDTLESVAGLDSIVVLTLNVNDAQIPENKVKYSTTINAGETYLFGCELLTAEGEYKDTLQGATGDSIVILTLTVNTVVPCDTAYGTDEMVGCDSVIFKGTKYTADAIVKDTIIGGAASGCDSIVTVTITVHHSVTGTDAIDGCDSVVFKGKKYIADATVLDTLTGVNGCDSIVTVTITVKHSVTGTDQLTGCDSVQLSGKTYYADTVVQDTLTAVSGCDSIVTVTITIKHSSVGDTTAVECDQFIWYEHTITESGDYTHAFTNAVGCDSVVTLHATIHKSASTTMDPVSECNKYYWESADTLITTSGTYTHVFQTVNGCDSVVSLTADISVPYVTTLTLVHKFGNRLLMIHRNEINSLWENFHLDSLDIEHPEYVIWHQIDLAGKDSIVGQGYTYSLESGDPLPTGYSYYAIIEIPAGDGNCGAEGKTMIYTIPAPAGAPALMPSLARPGEDIKVINLDPDVETTIRIFTAEGSLQRLYTVSGQEHFTIKAAYGQGFYLVEVIADNMKSTLRYIVQ